MPDSVNRIVSSPIAQEGYLLRRREREKKDDRGQEQEDNANEVPRSAPDTQVSSRRDEQVMKSTQNKTKGKIVDINV